jgi:hypothetical protein
MQEKIDDLTGTDTASEDDSTGPDSTGQQPGREVSSDD